MVATLTYPPFMLVGIAGEDDLDVPDLLSPKAMTTRIASFVMPHLRGGGISTVSIDFPHRYPDYALLSAWNRFLCRRRTPWRLVPEAAIVA